MEIPSNLLKRMPLDLQQHILKHGQDPTFLTSESDPTDVASEIISAASFLMKAYFPRFRNGNTVVCLWFPGGELGADWRLLAEPDRYLRAGYQG